MCGNNPSKIQLCVQQNRNRYFVRVFFSLFLFPIYLALNVDI